MEHHSNSLISDEQASNEQFAADAGLTSYEQQRQAMFPDGADMVDISEHFSEFDGFNKKAINGNICSSLEYRINKLRERFVTLSNDSRPDPNGYRANEMSEIVSNAVVIKAAYKDACKQFQEIYNGENWDDYKHQTKDSGVRGKMTTEQIKEAAQSVFGDD